MKLKTIAVALLACKSVVAHTLFTTLFVNDQSQGDGTCIRQPRDPSTATNPIIDLSSNDMMCGVNGDKEVARTCSVPQSAKLSFLFRFWPDGTKPGALDPSHKGACAVYMKAQRFGGDWFKIYDDGYDASTSLWCTEKVIRNNGFLSVNLPGDLLNTYYLVRVELLSLHEADKGQPQFYTGCAQIYLNSTGTSLPSDTVKIPGYVSTQGPSMTYNIYEPAHPVYPLPGPKRYISGSSPSTKHDVQEPQKEGLLPINAIITNANWWGVEVTPYNDESTCRESATQCWKQTTDCYDSAPPTGSRGCLLWELKCEEINADCNKPNPKGPLKAGEPMFLPLPAYSPIPPAQTDSTSPQSAAQNPPVLKLEQLAESASSTVVRLISSTIVSSASALPLISIPDNLFTRIQAGMSSPTTSTPASDSIPLPPPNHQVLRPSSTSPSPVTLTVSTDPIPSPPQNHQILVPSSSNASSVAGSASTMTNDPTSSALPFLSIDPPITPTLTTIPSLTSPVPTHDFPLTTDGRCGSPVYNTGCWGSVYGECGSSKGYCGQSAAHCGSGKCQPDYGLCGDENVKEEITKVIDTRYMGGKDVYWSRRERRWKRDVRGARMRGYGRM